MTWLSASWNPSCTANAFERGEGGAGEVVLAMVLAMVLNPSCAANDVRGAGVLVGGSPRVNWVEYTIRDRLQVRVIVGVAYTVPRWWI